MQRMEQKLKKPSKHSSISTSMVKKAQLASSRLLNSSLQL